MSARSGRVPGEHLPRLCGGEGGGPGQDAGDDKMSVVSLESTSQFSELTVSVPGMITDNFQPEEIARKCASHLG